MYLRTRRSRRSSVAAAAWVLKHYCSSSGAPVGPTDICACQAGTFSWAALHVHVHSIQTLRQRSPPLVGKRYTFNTNALRWRVASLCNPPRGAQVDLSVTSQTLATVRP
ncbi:hypothetical protein PF008_g23570 [Phytophthora fragariae]|uniref:Uncharacterized protein n=1 Tax=Phytophthora fragariae TaxID=53985 RepID=A0A6G0QRE6_9STRA|nr:hypothetical protein PF008_g23570 [Phytophthora fragariae]